MFQLTGTLSGFCAWLLDLTELDLDPVCHSWSPLIRWQLSERSLTLPDVTHHDFPDEKAGWSGYIWRLKMKGKCDSPRTRWIMLDFTARMAKPEHGCSSEQAHAAGSVHGCLIYRAGFRSRLPFVVSFNSLAHIERSLTLPDVTHHELSHGKSRMVRL